MELNNNKIYSMTHQAKRWAKWFLPFYLLTFLPLAVLAQQITGRAPSQVAVGEQFRLTYTINTQDAKNFRAGNIPEELDVLMGPSTSTQSSFQLVNGHMSSSSSVTYTYILVANKNGSYTIPAAQATIDGKTVRSNELHIKVSGEASQNRQGGAQQGSPGQQVRPAGSAITGNDLFIRVTASKQRVREQEPILLTYKVYTQVGLTQLSGKMPDLKSFYTREVPLPQEKSFHLETLNGRQYKTVTWQQYVMFPQTTGKLQIPSISYEGLVVQQNRNVDPFEAFFNGGSGYVEVKKIIKAPGTTIQVDPLPQRPQNFSGGVGSFRISAKIDQTEVKANDPVKLHVVVSGVGNMKLLKQPVVKFPKDFDAYDAKVTDNTKLTVNGLEGSISYDFLAVPRHQGSYDIPPIEYVYFDVKEGAYKTLCTEGFTIKVAKGDGSNTVSSFGGQESVRQLTNDIRYIKTGATKQRARGEFLFGSSTYWTLIAVLLLIFISLFIIFRRRAIENANIVKQRAGKANKVAVKRLKKASKLMKANKPNEFYDEVLRALWGFVGDKLNIPVEQLSRDNISQQLSSHAVSEDVINQFIGALDECEFARFAPGDTTGNMNKVYDAAMTAITQIATTMKKGKKSETRGERIDSSRLIIILLISFSSCLLPLTASAVTKAEADSLYAAEHYQQAAHVYEDLLKKGVSADLYYNLGNSYYRMDNITQAVLNYERAALLSPGDRDIRLNLQLARSKTIDKVVPESEMFFVTWYRALVNLTSVDGWAYTALLSLVAAIILALVYLFTNGITVRKIGFFGALLSVLLFALSNLFAWQQKRALTLRSGAIIIQSAVPVKSTPTKNGTDLFILHEGTKVIITDGSMKGWKAIRVADGKEGWLETNQIEVI